MAFWACCFGLLVLVVAPVLLRHAMSGNESFDIQDMREIDASVSMALELSSMTDIFVKEPHSGGILREYDLIDVQPYLKNKTEYQLGHNCVLWCFEMKPERVEQCGGLVTIYVRRGHKNSFNIAVLPLFIKNKCKMLKFTIESSETDHE